MLKSLKARSKQADSYLALMGHPNAFPSVPKASASNWTIMQSLHVETLLHTMTLKPGKSNLGELIHFHGKWKWINSPRTQGTCVF